MLPLAAVAIGRRPMPNKSTIFVVRVSAGRRIRYQISSTVETAAQPNAKPRNGSVNDIDDSIHVLAGQSAGTRRKEDRSGRVDRLRVTGHAGGERRRRVVGRRG